MVLLLLYSTELSQNLQEETNEREEKEIKCEEMKGKGKKGKKRTEE